MTFKVIKIKHPFVLCCLLRARKHNSYSSISSVQFNHSLSDSLGPHGLQHARLLCPSPTLRVCPNSCPLSQWSNPTISSSVIPFSSCPQSFPASGSFQMSQLFPSRDQSIGVSASVSVLPVNTQDWFPLGWIGSPRSPKILKSLLQHHSSKASVLQPSAFFIVQLSHPYMYFIDFKWAKIYSIFSWAF